MQLNGLITLFAAWCVFLAGPVVPMCCAGSQSFESDRICWWSFEEKRGNVVIDKAQRKEDPVYGPFDYVPGVQGRAIKLDGFRTYIKRDRLGSTEPSGSFTVESWIALASYPWSWAPVLDCSSPPFRGFFFGIDSEGRIGFKIASGSAWYDAVTTDRIPLRIWTHIAAVYDSDTKISLYINGREAGTLAVEGHYVPARYGTLTIGRNNRAKTWREFQLTTEEAYFFLDGLLDEVIITDRAKTRAEIRRACDAVEDPSAPALSDRNRLPVGPVGSGSFGAFYTRLDYYKEWDDLWRVSDVPDLYVRFDRSPVQLVFWRGTSFVPCWVTENGVWYLNEWLETWGGDVVSCAEPIMDRHCRYSHVRLIENTDARVVIHWRYALSDAFYTIAATGDDGRGEWCDEFHIIYPDQVGVRKMQLHYSKPERKHDWVEQIVVLPPGRYPDDVIETSGISLVNMSGEVHAYSWHDDDLNVEMPDPEGANISYVHLKSRYRPFIIVSPEPVDTVEGTWPSPFFRTYAAKMARGYRQDPVPSVYGWWNHWPVAQIPGDGRWVSTPDRPSHFNLTTFVQWRDYARTDKTRTRIMLQGMTEKRADGLVPLAKSWLKAPTMRVTSSGYRAEGYDPSERAYLVERTGSGDSSSCMFVLEASEKSPLVNPAIIVKNWGNLSATLTLDGVRRPSGKHFRQGIRRGPLGDDLIVWIELDLRKPVEIILGRDDEK